MKPPESRKPRVQRAKVPASRMSAPMGQWFQSLNLSAATVSTLAMVVLGVIMLAPPVQIWFTQRQQIADLKAQVAQAKTDLEQMQTERKRWQDPVYIRSQARDRLYYVMPGEVSYLVMDADGVDLSDTSGTVGALMAKKRSVSEISQDILHTKSNWVNGIVQSVMRAGMEDPLPAEDSNPSPTSKPTEE